MKWLGGLTTPGERSLWFESHIGLGDEPPNDYPILKNLQQDYNEGLAQCWNRNTSYCRESAGSWINECAIRRGYNKKLNRMEEYCGQGDYYDPSSAYSPDMGGPKIPNRPHWYWDYPHKGGASQVKIVESRVDFGNKQMALLRSNGQLIHIKFHDDSRYRPDKMFINNVFVPGTGAFPSRKADGTIALPKDVLNNVLTGPVPHGFSVDFASDRIITASTVEGANAKAELVLTLWRFRDGAKIHQYKLKLEEKDKYLKNIPIQVDFAKRHALVGRRTTVKQFDFFAATTAETATYEDTEMDSQMQQIRYEKGVKAMSKTNWLGQAAGTRMANEDAALEKGTRGATTMYNKNAANNIQAILGQAPASQMAARSKQMAARKAKAKMMKDKVGKMGKGWGEKGGWSK